MSKFIINNKSSLSDPAALDAVLAVIDKGKISRYLGTLGYCCATTFDDCYIECDLTRNGTHSFKITDK